MPRTKKAPPPTGTSHLFAPRKPGDRGSSVTSERIAEDLATFRRSGGRIEVLGNTRSLTRIGVPDAAPSEVAAAPAQAAKPGRKKTA